MSQLIAPSSSRDSTPLKAQVSAILSARLVINTGQRMVYPFLPAIARGLNVSIQTAGQLLALRFAIGLLSPLFGPVSDRVGRRRVMVSGLAALLLGALLILLPGFSAVVAGFLLLGLAKAVFDPSLYAYLGDRVPYHRRGRFIAIVELAWGGALVLGAPIIGWLITVLGWRSAFLCVAVAALVTMGGLLLALPSGRDGFQQNDVSTAGFSLRWILGNRTALAALGAVALMMMSNELQFVVYGPWMERQFGLSVGGLGTATVVIGAAEILGEIGVGSLVDRLGKRRSVAAGLALTAACYFVLPALSASVGSALAMLFALFLCFEFTVVANLPLATELVPQARATMMSLLVASSALGRMLGAWLGPLVWDTGGMAWNSIGAGLGHLLALFLVLGFVPEVAEAEASL